MTLSLVPTERKSICSIGAATSISRKNIILCLFLLSLLHFASGNEESQTEFGTMPVESETENGERHPAHAVLFPPFVLTLGVVVYYILSRFLHWLPYTAVMFVLGVVMGLVSATEKALNPNSHEHYMFDTLFAWKSINSEVLLLVFLPGLIFKDALSQNAYLFAIGFIQLFIFAFPMVLAGTALTACIAYYIFPFGWSFSLCLTFGSILSATDPVAVAALLEEVGAPPRLSTHIAGESLLNDGAAIVFFFIFSEIFFSESNVSIPGFIHHEIGFGEGVKIFVQKALGGSAIGFVAGAVIIFVMGKLTHRHSREENIVQVTAVLGLVYLNYFVADLVCSTSGVIATVAAGLCVKFFGRSVINDIHLMDDFFNVLEHILNTVLFTLGGLVWGNILVEDYRSGYWGAREWGYLIILYLLLHVIRAVLFVAAYPITVRIGLKTSWQETAFQIYGGLRGAVGIALAIALDNETDQYENLGMEAEVRDVAQLYSMVGGVAFLTLVINGSTAGPLLKKLGLAASTEAREKIIEAYKVHLRSEQIDFCVKLFTSERYKYIDFSFVQNHIPFLEDLTVHQLADAVEKLKGSTPIQKYTPPYLENVLMTLEKKDCIASLPNYVRPEILNESQQKYARIQRIERRKRGRMTTLRSSMAVMMKGDPLSTKELRLLFISMLRSQYEGLIDEGLLTSEHFLTIALEQSLKLAETEVNKGGPLNDLFYLRHFHSIAVRAHKIGWMNNFWCRSQKKENMELHSLIIQELAFAHAHERAQEFFQDQLGFSDSDLSEGGKIVIAESTRQLKMVERDVTNEKTRKFVTEVTTHKFCDILLNRSIQYVEKLVHFGLLKDAEAEEMIEEIHHLQTAITTAKLNMNARASQEDFVCSGVSPTPPSPEANELFASMNQIFEEDASDGRGKELDVERSV